MLDVEVNNLTKVLFIATMTLSLVLISVKVRILPESLLADSCSKYRTKNIPTLHKLTVYNGIVPWKCTAHSRLISKLSCESNTSIGLAAN